MFVAVANGVVVNDASVMAVVQAALENKPSIVYAPRGFTLDVGSYTADKTSSTAPLAEADEYDA
jgi:hypothetical protein